MASFIPGGQGRQIQQIGGFGGGANPDLVTLDDFDFPMWESTLTDFYYTAPGIVTVAAGAITANRLYMLPVWVPYAMTITDVVVAVTTGAAGNVRMGVYSMINGAPGLRLDSGDTGQSVSSTGSRVSKSVSVVIDKPQWVFLALDSDVAFSTNRCSAHAQVGPIQMQSDGTTAMTFSFYRTFNYAALPADETAQSYTIAATTAVPVVAFKGTAL